jgi:hypothetical protein
MRFEKFTTRVRSRLSWKAESNTIVAIPSKVEESRDAADPYRREILRLRYAPLTITMLRQLFQQHFPVRPCFVARFFIGFANCRVGRLA